MSETDLQAAIRTALEKLGAIVIRVQSGTVRGMTGSFVHLAPKGCPDLLVCHERRGPVMLEVKLPGGSCTAEQLKFHTELDRRGMPVYVVRSVEAALRAVGGGS